MKSKPPKYLYNDRIHNKKTGVNFEEALTFHNIELHWHDFFELEIVIDGKAEHILNGKKMEMSRGSFYFLRLTDFHKINPDPCVHILNIKLEESKFSQSILNISSKIDNSTVFKLNEEDLVAVEKLFRLCIAENSLFDPDSKYINHLVDCILIKTINQLDSALPPSRPREDTPLQSAISYIDMHFRESPTLSQVSKIAHYNTSHFSSSFHKAMGMTYSEYLNMLKLSYAKELLLSTDLKIADICYECGFTSTSNFLRIFKKAVGISPLQFRKISTTK